MANRNDIWYVPKRTSVHQIIGLVEALISKSLSGKTFRAGQQEALATELRKKGLTQSRNLSQQSVRTLLASGPQYLGLVYKTQEMNTVKLFVTKAGEALAAEGNLLTKRNYSNLAEWEKGHPFPMSEVILNQLMKLIINNPVSTNSGSFSIFPFRVAIQLVIELGYVDFEELGYLVFQLAQQENVELLKQRILNFRTLSSQNREHELDAFKKTEAGNLALVQAPSATYFMNICVYSGLFEIEQVATSNAGLMKALVLKDIEKAEELLKKFSSSRTYDFKANLELWIEYFGNPDRLELPFDYILHFTSPLDTAHIVELRNEEGSKKTLTFDGRSASWSVALFKSEKYHLIVHNAVSPDSTQVDFIPGEETVISIPLEMQEPSQAIEEFESSKSLICAAINEVQLNGWDARITKRIELVKQFTGRDHLNNRIKGGRLEELFCLLLKIAESEGRVDSVRWYGSYGQDGMPGPAPGGKDGNPDIVFEIDDIAVVIELTTIRGTRAQWTSSEAASVPDHINTYVHQDPNSRVAGIFSAPSIDSRVRTTFALHEAKSKVPIICINLNDLAELVGKERAEIKEYLVANLDRLT